MQKTCPVCENGNIVELECQPKDYLTNHSFQLGRCLKCGSMITIGANDIDFCKYYGDNYYNSPEGKFRPIIENIFRFNHKRNAKSLLNKWHPQRVLEIGCGRAYLLKELQALGVEVHALESSSAPVWILNNPIVNVIGLADENQYDWPFAPCSFQLVIYWHVLEHLSSPDKSLKQAARVLDDKGIVCVSIPNIMSYQARLNLCKWFHLDVPRHIFHFSPDGIRELLERNGFEMLYVKSGDTIQNLYGWFQSLANLISRRNSNSLYMLLQKGGDIKDSVSKIDLFSQIISAVVWFPIGILGYVIEMITGNYGTMTVVARKKRKRSTLK